MNRIAQLQRIIRYEFDSLELPAKENEAKLLIETSIINGLVDQAEEMQEDLNFELERIQS